MKITIKEFQPKVVAQQGDDIFLIQVSPNEGQVFDSISKRQNKPRNLESIIARGYWEDVTGDESEVLAKFNAQVQQRKTEG